MEDKFFFKNLNDIGLTLQLDKLNSLQRISFDFLYPKFVLIILSKVKT